MGKYTRDRNKETIIAVITAYNRPELVKRCIENISRQTRPVEGGIVLDNSINEPARMEIENLCSRYGFKYICPNDNLGSAGGFSLGMERAYKDHATWIWLHDQDDYPDQRCLQKLLGSNQGFIRSPVIIDPETGKILTYFKRMKGRLGYFYPAPSHSNVIDVAGTAGLLIHRDVASKIGFYDPTFFLGFEDYDYCLRAKKMGFPVICSESAVVYHPCHKSQRFRSIDGITPILRNLPAFWGIFQAESPRDYYTIRNFIILSKRHQGKPIFFIQMMFSLLLLPVVRLVVPGSSIRQTLKIYAEALCVG